MDVNRIIQMIVNQLLRRAVNGGVDAAIRQVSGRGRRVTPQDKDQAQAAQATTKRARQAARLMRKL